MGGDITAISRGKAFTPGKGLRDIKLDNSPGTTFKFKIKAELVRAKENEKALESRRAIALAPDQPAYRILIVDDTKENRQLLHKLLSRFGFTLQEASNGQEALEIWENWQPHLIWMDLRMTVMDGCEATKQIRAREEMLRDAQNAPISRTVIIALTASVLTDEKVAVLAAGCDDFIRKPFQEEEIFDAIHKHLGVSFIYEELTSDTEANLSESVPLTTASITGLPKELLVSLRQALVEGDLEAIASSINQVCLHNKNLGDALQALADQYQFEELLALIPPIKQV